MHPAIRLLALSVCVAATASAGPPKKAPAKPKPDPLANTKMLAPIQVDSLTLTPIVATAAPSDKPRVDVLALDEAMSSKKIRIREQTSETVNQLTFINKSEQPVFVLAGEVIIGGKQDRIIGANTIIPASTTLAVPVFCVEHGRWDNSGKEFKSANALAHGRLRAQASFAAQGDVWNEVAAKNRARKTANATDTYRQVAEQQNTSLKTHQTKIDEAIAKIPAADRANMVGYVVAINGAVATVDMFQSPALFKKLEPKLIKSYVTEAVDVVATKDAKPPTAKHVREFIDDAEKAAEERAYANKAAKSYKKSGAKTGKASVNFSEDAVDAAPVYQNYQAK